MKIFPLLILILSFLIGCVERQTTQSKNEKVILPQDSIFAGYLPVGKTYFEMTNGLTDFTTLLEGPGYKIYFDSVKSKYIMKEYYENNSDKAIREMKIVDYRQSGGEKRFIKDGESLIYYRSGELYGDENYLNDLLEGGQKYYYKNGEVQSSKYYHEQFLDGISVSYDSLGNIIKKILYKDNNPIKEFINR